MSEFSDVLEGASLVCVDANIPEATIKLVCDICWRAGVPGGCSVSWGSLGPMCAVCTNS